MGVRGDLNAVFLGLSNLNIGPVKHQELGLNLGGLQADKSWLGNLNFVFGVLCVCVWNVWVHILSWLRGRQRTCLIHFWERQKKKEREQISTYDFCFMKARLTVPGIPVMLYLGLPLALVFSELLNTAKLVNAALRLYDGISCCSRMWRAAKLKLLENQVVKS